MEPLTILERSRFGFESLTWAAEGKARLEQGSWRQGFRQHDLSGSFQSGSSGSLQGRQGELWDMGRKVGQELACQQALTELSEEPANSKRTGPVCVPGSATPCQPRTRAIPTWAHPTARP